MKLEDLEREVRKYLDDDTIEQIKKAYHLAELFHKGKERFSGDPYIEHPVHVALLLAKMRMGPNVLMAALLHDIVEDTEINLKTVEDKFGREVKDLVDGVTKLTKIRYHDRKEQDAEYIRKMFMATTKDIRVLIIKLADKLHNMRTLKYLPKDKQMKIAQDTLDIYAPLAYRLGMMSIKEELEDLSFMYLHPDLYKRFKRKFGNRLKRKMEIKKISKIISKALRKRGIEAEIKGRPKQFYSIYKKMIKKGRSFDELHDIIGLRIITKTVEECYEALGIIHSLWKPIAREFKDYIALPKSNMYQSLHTAVIHKEGPVEFQIRTEEMDKIAEEGIAAHWKYKGIYGDKKFDRKLSWIKQILEWQSDKRKSKEFIDFLKVDFFDDEIYVFTPHGEVINLPKDSTPIDFAYAIHSSIGDRCNGAIVNGRIVPLRQTLENGDIVRIKTSRNSKPKRDWLKIVRTTKARNRIRHTLKMTDGIAAKPYRREEVKKGGLVEIKKLKNPSIELAKCCNPIPGDKIRGFSVRHNNVKVHKADCESLKSLKKEKELKVKWKDLENQKVWIKILAEDRVGLLADVMNTIARTGTNIHMTNARTVGDNLMEDNIEIIADSIDHIRDIVMRIKKLQGIKKIATEAS